MTPLRIQLRRTKGLRMPANTVKVDRTTRWGNKHARKDRESRGQCGCNTCLTVLHWDSLTAQDEAAARQHLKGRNLACWCALCDEHKDGRPLDVPCKKCPPCHADNWGIVANA